MTGLANGTAYLFQVRGCAPTGQNSALNCLSPSAIASTTLSAAVAAGSNRLPLGIGYRLEAATFELAGERLTGVDAGPEHRTGMKLCLELRPVVSRAGATAMW